MVRNLKPKTQEVVYLEVQEELNKQLQTYLADKLHLVYRNRPQQILEELNKINKPQIKVGCSLNHNQIHYLALHQHKHLFSDLDLLNINNSNFITNSSIKPRFLYNLQLTNNSLLRHSSSNEKNRSSNNINKR